MPDQTIDGAIFRRNYVRSEVRLSDSMRARRRVLMTFMALNEHRQNAIVRLVQHDLGLDYPNSGFGYNHEKYWTKIEIDDFLSSVTYIFREATNQRTTLSLLRQIFAEEFLRYSIDDLGGVHYLVDEQFERNVASAIDGLGAAKFAASRHALELALEGMNGADRSGKALIRGVFEALESAFLVRILPEIHNRINDQNIEQHLRPILIARYANVPEPDDKVDRVLALLKAWVKTAHPFRHGVAFEAIHEAPFDYAILIADQGMAFLRYIVGP
jgi:hypothetical protein